MPLLIIMGILAAVGVGGAVTKDKGKKYTNNDMENMLIEMTGKSKRECKKILKKCGRG